MLRETLATCTTRQVACRRWLPPGSMLQHGQGVCQAATAYAVAAGLEPPAVRQPSAPTTTLQACWPHLLTLSAPTQFVQTSLAHQNPGRTIRLGVQAIDGVRAPGAVGDGCPEISDDEHGIGLGCKQLRPADNRTAWRCLATGGSWRPAPPGPPAALHNTCIAFSVLSTLDQWQPLKGTQACF